MPLRRSENVAPGSALPAALSMRSAHFSAPLAAFVVRVRHVPRARGRLGEIDVARLRLVENFLEHALHVIPEPRLRGVGEPPLALSAELLLQIPREKLLLSLARLAHLHRQIIGERVAPHDLLAGPHRVRSLERALGAGAERRLIPARERHTEIGELLRREEPLELLSGLRESPEPLTGLETPEEPGSPGISSSHPEGVIRPGRAASAASTAAPRVFENISRPVATPRAREGLSARRPATAAPPTAPPAAPRAKPERAFSGVEAAPRRPSATIVPRMPAPGAPNGSAIGANSPRAAAGFISPWVSRYSGSAPAPARANPRSGWPEPEGVRAAIREAESAEAELLGTCGRRASERLRAAL